MSPRSTFQSCGNSSRLVLRRNPPMRVTRGSSPLILKSGPSTSFMWSTSARRFSAPTLIVRNFAIEKVEPSPLLRNFGNGKGRPPPPGGGLPVDGRARGVEANRKRDEPEEWSEERER